MPSKSPAQHRLMEAAAHTKGGFGGVPQKVGKDFAAADDKSPRNPTIVSGAPQTAAADRPKVVHAEGNAYPASLGQVHSLGKLHGMPSLWRG